MKIQESKIIKLNFIFDILNKAIKFLFSLIIDRYSF